MDAKSQRAYLRALGIPLYWPRHKPLPARTTLADGGEAGPPEGLSTAASGPARHGEGSAVGNEREARRAALEELREEVLHCTACPLHQTRTQGVFGVGNPEARVMFVGEAPGAEEDRRGEPFVGRAGRLLDAMLAAIDLDRNTVFITNVLKSRPPNNRDPRPEEVAQCEGYLRRQIELIRPELLVALGRVAAQNLLKTQKPLNRLRGTEQHYAETPLVITYHPAYLLRNPKDKAKAWVDLKTIRRYLRTPSP